MPVDPELQKLAGEMLKQNQAGSSPATSTTPDSSTVAPLPLDLSATPLSNVSDPQNVSTQPPPAVVQAAPSVPASTVDNLKFERMVQEQEKEINTHFTNLDPVSKGAVAGLTSAADIFGLVSFMSRNGLAPAEYLFTTPGQTAAYFEAMKRVVAKAPITSAVGIGGLTGETAKFVGEFAAAPALGATGQVTKVAAKFATHALMQAPTADEQSKTLPQALLSRGEDVAIAAGTGAGFGLAGKYIKNPIASTTLLGTVMGGATLAQGGSWQDVAKTEAQLAGFTLWGVGSKVLAGKSLAYKFEKSGVPKEQAADLASRIMVGDMAGADETIAKINKAKPDAAIPPASDIANQVAAELDKPPAQITDPAKQHVIATTTGLTPATTVDPVLPKQIKSAWRMPDGSIETDSTKVETYIPTPAADGKPGAIPEQGFVTDKGEFQTPDQAWELMKNWIKTSVDTQLTQQPAVETPKIERSPADKLLIQGIQKQRSLMNMSDTDYGKLATDTTGISTTTGMDSQQLQAFHDKLLTQYTNVFATQTAKDIGMTDVEKTDLTSRIKGTTNVVAQATQKVFSYMKNQPLSSDPDIRRRQIQDGKNVAIAVQNDLSKTASTRSPYSILGKLEKKWQSFREGVHSLASMPYWFGDLDLRTGRRFYDSTQSLTHSADAAAAEVTQQYDSLFKLHNQPTQNLTGLSIEANNRISNWLFSTTASGPSENSKAEFAKLSPEEQKVGLVAMNYFHNNPDMPESGEGATRLRSIEFQKWRYGASQIDRKIEAEYQKEKPDPKRMLELQAKKEELLPHGGATLQDMTILDKAWSEGDELTYRKNLQSMTWGTKNEYFKTDDTYKDYLTSLLDLVHLPDLFNVSGKTVSAKADLPALHEREGTGTPLQGKDIYAVIHLDMLRKIMLDKTFNSLIWVTDEAKGAGLAQKEASKINQWLSNIEGGYQEISPVGQALSWLRKKSWQVLGSTPSYQGRFASRQVGQPFLGLAFADAPALAAAEAKAFTNPNPWLAEGQNRYFSGWSTKAQLSNMMNMQEAVQGGGGVVDALNNFGAQGFAVTDGVARTVSYKGFHQLAFDTLQDWTSGKITTKQLYSTLKLDIASMPERRQLESYLPDKEAKTPGDMRKFVDTYAENWTNRTNFEYAERDRSAMEQHRETKNLMGLLTFPRNVSEQYYRSGIKVMADGFKEGDGQKVYEGLKVVGKYAAAFATLGKVYRDVLGDNRAYGLVQSPLWLPGRSPEITLMANMLNTVNSFANSATGTSSNQKDDTATQAENLFYAGMKVGGTMSVPIVVGLLDGWVKLSEDIHDVKGLKAHQALQEAYKNFADIELGKTTKYTDRTFWQKFLHVMNGSQMDVESEAKKKENRQDSPVKSNIQSAL